MDSETRSCQNCKQNFQIEEEDFEFYKKLDVPPPTWCPKCRMIRRYAWRSQKNIYKKKDAHSQELIFSSFPETSPLNVYELSYWNSDDWDPMIYGRDYDLSRTFFDQLKELFYTVPQPSRAGMDLKNSDYCNQCSFLKNCYMCFDIDYAEDSGYIIHARETNNCWNGHTVRESELCQENYMIINCYRVFYSFNCDSSSDVWFSKDLTGCSNCFSCVGLRNKSYCIFNKQYSKEDYSKFIQSFENGSYLIAEEAKKKAEKLWLDFPVKFMQGTRNFNCTGNEIKNSKNVKNCFDVHDGQDLKYCQEMATQAADSYDYTIWGDSAARMYEDVTCGYQADSIKFSFDCWSSVSDLEYCLTCRTSSNLFGCVGLKNKKFCIFNKQYSEEEYHSLRKKIIDQMRSMPYEDSRGRTYSYGEFFPFELSPFGYNETLAFEHFPIDKRSALSFGFNWRDTEKRDYAITLKSSQIPDNIKDIDEDICKEIIECGHKNSCLHECTGAFRVIPLEFNFYKNMGLPLPRLCSNCRHMERLKWRNPLQLWSRKCMCCGKSEALNSKSETGYLNTVDHFHGNASCPNEFETSYSPDRPEIVYCENCYNSEVA